MHESIHLGTFRGIAIGCNWSVLAIAALLTWGLADGYLPEATPGYRAGEYWLAAVVAVVLFFGSLVAHELGHSVVAQRNGVGVESITLWLFGGVARLRGESPTPAAELRIAAAGPAVSTGITAVAGLGALAFAAGDLSDLGIGMLAWIALINGMLAVFNLAPAAPLDGGRILHAAVWGATRDRSRATRVATGAGRVFGYILIGSGILMVAGGAIGGAWLALVGWFVITAANAEATHSLLHGALAGVRVRDVMTADPIVVPRVSRSRPSSSTPFSDTTVRRSRSWTSTNAWWGCSRSGASAASPWPTVHRAWQPTSRSPSNDSRSRNPTTH